MAKASIHIAKGSAGFVAHNDRTTKTANSIFTDEENEYSATAQQAFAVYREELRKRSEAYTNRTGQALQKNTTTHLSAIVNLNAEHTLEDLQPLIDHLEKTLDTKVFQVCIHRDEGHIDSETGEAKKNYHAHIEFMGLDTQGASIRRKLTKSYLRDLQSKTASILGMERGQEGSKTKRLDTYEFKKHKQREEQTIKALKQENKALKEENKELKSENEAILYNFREMQKKITALENLSNEQKKELHKLNSLVKNKKAEVKDLIQALKTAQKTIEEQKETITIQKEKISELEAKISELQDKITELEDKLKQRDKMTNRQTTRKELKQAQKQLKEANEELESFVDIDLSNATQATNANNAKDQQQNTKNEETFINF